MIATLAAPGKGIADLALQANLRHAVFSRQVLIVGSISIWILNKYTNFDFTTDDRTAKRGQGGGFLSDDALDLSELGDHPISQPE